MGALSNDDLNDLLSYLQQIGQDPSLELTPELREKVNLALAMQRAGRIVVAKDGSVAIGGDATGNTFHLAPVINLSLNETSLFEEIIAIHNFDLTNLLDHCVDHIVIHSQGVIGFGLPCNIPKLLPSICERLKIRLTYDNAEVKDHIALDRSFAANIDDIVKEFFFTHKMARIPNTIFSVQTFENESGELLWEHLKENEHSLPTKTRLIVIMAVEQDFVFPSGLLRLHPPEFRPAHVHEFFTKVVYTRKQKWENSTVSTVVEQWVNSLVAYCKVEEVLYQKSVYQYLKITLDAFKRNDNPEKFLSFLKELEEPM